MNAERSSMPFEDYHGKFLDTVSFILAEEGGGSVLFLPFFYRVPPDADRKAKARRSKCMLIRWQDKELTLPPGTSVRDCLAALGISEGALAAMRGGQVLELNETLREDSELNPITLRMRRPPHLRALPADDDAPGRAPPVSRRAGAH